MSSSDTMRVVSCKQAMGISRVRQSSCISRKLKVAWNARNSFIIQSCCCQPTCALALSRCIASWGHTQQEIFCPPLHWLRDFHVKLAGPADGLCSPDDFCSIEASVHIVPTNLRTLSYNIQAYIWPWVSADGFYIRAVCFLLAQISHSATSTGTAGIQGKMFSKADTMTRVLKMASRRWGPSITQQGHKLSRR